MNYELRETCAAPELSKCSVGEMTCLRPHSNNLPIRAVGVYTGLFLKSTQLV